jgi:glycosyltransferase involved in cell wall biosynthesis
MKPRVLIFCNALDDVTRQQRGITTDSPAASRKIFMLCQALRLAGVRPLIVSMGRGRAGGSREFFPSVLRRVEGVPIFYAPFSRVPFLSELLSLLVPLVVIFKLRRQCPRVTIFYNRLTAYIPSLLMSSMLRYRNVLDLEDGEVSASGHSRVGFVARLVSALFDRFCGGGAMLACNALAEFTTSRPVLSYYGTAAGVPATQKLTSNCVTVLMGGTLCLDTGAELLIDAIRELRREVPPWAEQLRFEVTGSGPSLAGLTALAAGSGYPEVIVHGRTTDLQYREVLGRCDVGLALKLYNGPLAHTTFPSKVIEFAAEGLLVLTTDISDVRCVLGDGARYLTRDEPRELIDALENIVKNRLMAHECAQSGLRRVKVLCSPRSSGQTVANFIFGNIR